MISLLQVTVSWWAFLVHFQNQNKQLISSKSKQTADISNPSGVWLYPNVFHVLWFHFCKSRSADEHSWFTFKTKTNSWCLPNQNKQLTFQVTCVWVYQNVCYVLWFHFCKSRSADELSQITFKNKTNSWCLQDQNKQLMFSKSKQTADISNHSGMWLYPNVCHVLWFHFYKSRSADKLSWLKKSRTNSWHLQDQNKQLTLNDSCMHLDTHILSWLMECHSLFRFHFCKSRSADELPCFCLSNQNKQLMFFQIKTNSWLNHSCDSIQIHAFGHTHPLMINGMSFTIVIMSSHVECHDSCKGKMKSAAKLETCFIFCSL